MNELNKIVGHFPQMQIDNKPFRNTTKFKILRNNEENLKTRTTFLIEEDLNVKIAENFLNDEENLYTKPFNCGVKNI